MFHQYLAQKSLWRNELLPVRIVSAALLILSFLLGDPTFSAEIYVRNACVSAVNGDAFFEYHEMVQLGVDTPNQEDIQFPQDNLQTYVLPKNFLPALVWYVAPATNGRHFIEFFVNNIIHRILVPASAVHKLPLGTSSRYRNALSPYLSLTYSFSAGEKVRFRDLGSGKMRTGLYQRSIERQVQKPKRAVLLDENNLKTSCDYESVFKLAPGTSIVPNTPRFSAPPDFEDSHPHGEIADLLNAIAKLTSQDSFLQKTELSQIKAVSNYIVSILDYKKINVGTALSRFNLLLTAGIGVCRHTAVLLAMALNEMGVPAVVKYSSISGKDGHACVEVPLFDSETGLSETVLIETTTASLFPLADILSGANKPLLAEWYLAPNTQVLEPKTRIK